VVEHSSQHPQVKGLSPGSAGESKVAKKYLKNSKMKQKNNNNRAIKTYLIAFKVKQFSN
jgi:hypothetical protein